MIYVGKAKSLRSRVCELLPEPARACRRAPPRWWPRPSRVEWIQVRNEVEALMLEYSLIKQHRPRFNIRLRDDKSYPFLAVTLDEEWPRAMVMRGRKRKGVRYFGPYGHAYAIRETLDLLLRTFPIRTCSRQQVRPAPPARAGRACCSTSRSARGRASARSTSDAYDGLVAGADRLPRRRHRRRSSQRLEPTMREAADEPRVRAGGPAAATGSTSVRKAIERQQMVAERSEDIDVIGIADDELEAAVQVFYVRRGRVVGRKGFIVDKVEDLSPGELVGSDPRGPVRRRAAAGRAQAGARAGRARAISTLRGVADADAGLAGSPIRVPQRGDKRALLETVTRNAKEEFTRHRLRRAADHNSRARALNELQDALGLPEAPLRIECYDMSHIQGTDYVGSMVVMEDGLPEARASTAGSRCKGVAGQRRLRRHGGGAHPPAHRLPRASATSRSTERPGGSPTRRSCCWSTAARASSAWPSGCVRGAGPRARRSRSPSLAKRFEEVYVPGQAEPVAHPPPVARRCTCCSASATRPTASPSPSTASCGASA